MRTLYQPFIIELCVSGGGSRRRKTIHRGRTFQAKDASDWGGHRSSAVRAKLHVTLQLQSHWDTISFSKIIGGVGILKGRRKSVLNPFFASLFSPNPFLAAGFILVLWIPHKHGANKSTKGKNRREVSEENWLMGGWSKYSFPLCPLKRKRAFQSLIKCRCH